MKTFLFLISVVLLGCDTDEINRNAERNKSFKSQIETEMPLYKVVTIDSCEYLLTEYWSSNASLSHKGNCKYCIQRNKNNRVFFIFNKDSIYQMDAAEFNKQYKPLN